MKAREKTKAIQAKTKAIFDYVMHATSNYTNKDAIGRPFDGVVKLSSKKNEEAKSDESSKKILSHYQADMKAIDKFIRSLSLPLIPNDNLARGKMILAMFQLFDSLLDRNYLTELCKGKDKDKDKDKDKKKSLEAKKMSMHILSRYIFLVLGSKQQSLYGEDIKVSDFSKEEAAKYMIQQLLPFYRDRTSLWDEHPIEVTSAHRLLLRESFDDYLKSEMICGNTFVEKFFKDNIVVNGVEKIVRPVQIKKTISDLDSKLRQYNTDKRKTHKNELKSLLTKLDSFAEKNKYKDPDVTYKEIIRRIEVALEEAYRDYSKQLFRHGSKRPVDDYIDKVIQSKTSYQYPKLLSKVLCEAYEACPSLIDAKRKNSLAYKIAKGVAEYKVIKITEQKETKKHSK